MEIPSRGGLDAGDELFGTGAWGRLMGLFEEEGVGVEGILRVCGRMCDRGAVMWIGREG